MRNISFRLLSTLLALIALIAQTGSAAVITTVVETGGDNEATDTITAKWTGQTFPVSVANEPVPGAVVGDNYTVGVFGNSAPAFVDRNHRYTNASDTVSFPDYLVGRDYIMSGNDNRDNAGYLLDVTVASPVIVYLLVDNRLGDPNSPNTDPPSFGPTRMQWVLDQGWAAVKTGANRAGDANLPDEIGLDESADGTVNQWYSVYSKSFPAGTFQLRQADNAGQNMYGVVIAPAGPLSQVAQLGRNRIGTVTDLGGGSYTIVGAGNDIWDNIDEFTYAFTQVTGDFDVKVRVASLQANARWTKGGIMIRESLAEDSRMVFLRTTPPASAGDFANDTFLSYRTGKHEPTDAFADDHNGGRHEDRDAANTLPAPPYPNAWLRLTRVGPVFTAYNSDNGADWQVVSTQDTSMGDWVAHVGNGPFAPTALLGLGVSRHSAGPTAKAEFHDFALALGGSGDFKVIGASSRGNPTGIRVEFSKPVGAGAMTPANYALDNGAMVSAVAAGPNPATVQLTTTAALTEGTAYTLTVTGVEADGGGALTTGTASFTHGAGYEARLVRIARNMIPGADVDLYLNSLAYQKDIPVNSQDQLAVVSNDNYFEENLPDTQSNENYSWRVSGVFVAAATGDHRFFVSADDFSRLFISTDTDPANKVEIAREPEWNGSRQYATLDRRGDTRPNRSAPIALTTGNKYYLEQITSEGGGGNNSSTAVQEPGQPEPINGSLPIAASHFEPTRQYRGSVFSALGPVSIVRQPASIVAVEGTAATFSVRADGTPAYTYQWRKNGADIPGANGSSYTTPLLNTSANGAIYSVFVANEFSSATSTDATLNVTGDTVAPTLVRATAEGASFTKVRVVFSEPMDAATAETAGNYTLSGGGGVTGAVLAPGDGSQVLLTVTGLAEDTQYTLTVNNVKDRSFSGNVIAADSTVQFRTGVLLAGTLIKEYYLNITGGTVANLTSSAKYMNHQPDLVCFTNLFELNGPNQNALENYGSRILGYFTPDRTGNWKFYISTDDGGALFLSTDDTPGNRVQIATEPVWNGHRDWTGTTRRNAAAPENQSAPIPLVAGQKYYVELLHKEGGGGDNAAAAAQFLGDPADPMVPADPVPANGDNVIGPSFISAIIETGNLGVQITDQPDSISVFENGSATFTAAATVNNFYNCETRIHWERDGVAIDPAEPDPTDATMPRYTVNGLSLTVNKATLTDDGAKFRAVIEIPVRAATMSDEATLTVQVDNVAPTIVSVRGSAFFDKITIVFSELVDSESAQDGFNYQISGGVTLSGSPVLLADGRTVVLTLAAPMSEDTDYTVTVNNVLDLAENKIADASMSTFHSFVFSCGFVLFEAYDTGGGNTVSVLTSHPSFPDNPRDTAFISSFDSRNAYPDDSHEGYGARISGVFVPPTSGNWLFYIRSDDSSELWLNPSGQDAAGAQKVAEETSCCGAFGYKPEVISAPIPMTAGSRYFIQMLYKEGTGGDYGQVAAKLDTDPTPPTALRPIAANSLGLFADSAGASITITSQPEDVLFLIVPSTGGGAPVLDQNFDSGDGGFTVETPQAYDGPWTYSAASGSWIQNGQTAENQHANTSLLTSPELTISRAGFVEVTFVHRWSFETDWDGGQLHVSVNGGAFTVVPAGSFTQNGYNGALVNNSASILHGQQVFFSESAGHDSGALITSKASLGYLNAGDTIRLRFVAASDTNTSGDDPDWEITSVTVTDGGAPPTAIFTVEATGAIQGNPNQPVFYSWQRDNGSGFFDIPGTGSTLQIAPTLADNGARFRAVLYIPGAVRTTDVAVLTVAQPNTPPRFTCGPAQQTAHDAGPQMVPDWATDISVHSITRTSTSFSSDFGSQPPGTRILDPNGPGSRPDPRVEDGVLKLTDALDPGGFGGFAIGPFPQQTFETIEASWKSRIGGGGGGGADGYSFNIGNDLADNFQGEEGTGTGLSVAVDTFDNADVEVPDVGIEIVWRGARVAALQIPKDDDGSGNFLRKDTFVDASMSVNAAGLATFIYDGNTITAQLPDYAGIQVNQLNFGARTGGANDNQWIDDLSLEGFPFDASSAEAGQTVQFIVTNDNPSLFSSQPAVSPTGTLTYTPAPGNCGVAHVTIVAQDSGGTANGGDDTSAACMIEIAVTGCPNPPPVAQNSTVVTDKDTSVNFQLMASDPNGDPLTYMIVGAPAHGIVVLEVQTGAATYTPGAGYVGPDSFTFKVNDGTSDSGVATVTIDVRGPANQNPTADISASPLYDFTPAVMNPVVISCNGSNACLTLDGSGSSDPDGDALTYNWFLQGAAAPFASGAQVSQCFELGEYTIELMVSDGKGGVGTETLTVEVLTIDEGLSTLIDKINESSLSRTTKRPFIATLKAAAASAGRGEFSTTTQQLNAFQNKVRAQISRDNPTEAECWIRWAQHIIDAIDLCE